MLLVAVFTSFTLLYNVVDKIYKLNNTLELRSKSSLGWTLRTRQRGDLPSDSRLATSNTIHPMIVRI